MLAQATQGAGPHNKQHALSASSLAICPKSGRLTAEAPACPLEVALKRARDLAKIKKKKNEFFLSSLQEITIVPKLCMA